MAKEKIKKTRNLEDLETLKGKIKEALKLEDGAISTDSPVYEENLPEGIEMATVTKVKNYDRDFIAASSLAVGEVAIEAMANDSSLDSVSAHIDMCPGYDELDATVFREVSGTTGGKEWSQKGKIVAKYTATDASQKKGILKKVADTLRELGDQKL